MTIFGDLERTFADLYPYRWAFAAGLIILIAVSAGYAYRMGWHRFIWSHRVPASLVAVPALVVVVWVGWTLGSPLFTNTTVDEAFPFAVAPPGPSDTGRSPVATAGPLVVSKTPTVQPEITPVAATAGAATTAEPTIAEPTILEPTIVEPTVVEPTINVEPTVNREPTTTPSPSPTDSPEPVAPVILKAGEFQDIDGFHKGTGTATIYQGADGSRVIRFEDFKVTNGPDLHVVLSPYGGPQEVGGRLKSPGWIDLGKLKGNIGNQNYAIPEDVDIGIHNSVTIWCQPFDVIFSVAVLREGS